MSDTDLAQRMEAAMRYLDDTNQFLPKFSDAFLGEAKRRAWSPNEYTERFQKVLITLHRILLGDPKLTTQVLIFRPQRGWELDTEKCVDSFEVMSRQAEVQHHFDRENAYIFS